MGCGALPRLDPRWTREGVPLPVRPRPQGLGRGLIEELPDQLGMQNGEVRCRRTESRHGARKGDEQMPGKGLETVRAAPTGHPRRTTVAAA